MPRLASARAGNAIGGGDWGADRLIPDAVRAAAAGRPVRVRNPGATRPWQHVLNPLAGYLLLAERLCEDPAFATAWNFGPAEDEARPVGHVLDRLAALWPGGPRVGARRGRARAGGAPPEDRRIAGPRAPGLGAALGPRARARGDGRVVRGARRRRGRARCEPGPAQRVRAIARSYIRSIRST